MKQRDEAKQVAVKMRLLEDRLKYCKLRNQVTKMKKKRKRKSTTKTELSVLNMMAKSFGRS